MSSIEPEVPALGERIGGPGKRVAIMSRVDWLRWPKDRESLEAYRRAIYAERNHDCPVGEECEQCEDLAFCAVLHWCGDQVEREAVILELMRRPGP